MYEVEFSNDTFTFIREDEKKVIIGDKGIIGLSGNYVKRCPKYFNDLAYALALNAMPQQVLGLFALVEDSPCRKSMISYLSWMIQEHTGAAERIWKVILHKIKIENMKDNYFDWFASFISKAIDLASLAQRDDDITEKDIIDEINQMVSIQSYMLAAYRVKENIIASRTRNTFNNVVNGRPISEQTKEICGDIFKNYPKTCTEKNIIALAKAAVNGVIENLYQYFRILDNATNQYKVGQYNELNTHALVLAFLLDYLQMSNDLEETPNFNGNVLNKYVNLKRELEAKKNSIFANKQLEKNLTFEDDSFIVVVPTTIAELVKEGEEQHNCVGDYGYDKKVLEGKCNIVFIRKKTNPNKSYITCEINPNGHIIQYYLAHNYSVYDDNPAYSFKLKYIEYLQTIFC